MHDDANGERRALPAGGRSLLAPGRSLPTWAVARVVAIERGGRLPFVAADWQGSIVVVEQGEIVIEAEHGGQVRLIEGDLFWMDGLPIRAISNQGESAATLLSVTRRADPEEADS